MLGIPLLEDTNIGFKAPKFQNLKVPKFQSFTVSIFRSVKDSKFKNFKLRHDVGNAFPAKTNYPNLKFPKHKTCVWFLLGLLGVSWCLQR